MKVVIAGIGATANKHLAALHNLGGHEVVSVVGREAESTASFAAEHGIGHHTLDLAEALAQTGVEAAILTTPTQLHAAQTIQALEAGKHVLVEIPMADSLADAEAVVAAQQRTGLTAMVCHTRRFNPSHQWIHERVRSGQLTLQHLVVQTFFLRRENRNALGQPRSWTDHLLWHHACHTVDLFLHQTGARVATVCAQQGPPHPELGVAMDMSIGLQSASGALCTLALSFNNDGPFGSWFRYIGDTGTYVARYDELVDGYDKPVDLAGLYPSLDGYELQNQEFFAAIHDEREPNASVAQCLPAMATLDRIEQTLASVTP
jgi:2-hydroxy-4-carboxymuconate semialdehyde hemiacetal dehydrogenase